MITRQDVLEALGGETEDRFLTGMLVGVAVGALVGGVVALLMTPKTGSELREMISEKGGHLMARARERLGRSTGEAGGEAGSHEPLP